MKPDELKRPLFLNQLCLEAVVQIASILVEVRIIFNALILIIEGDTIDRSYEISSAGGAPYEDKFRHTAH